MLKFDLTRKYLVGFLTLAMVLSLFALPVSADVGPIVNVYNGSITMVPPYSSPPLPTTGTGSIATFTATFLDAGAGIPVGSSTIVFRIQTLSGLQRFTQTVTVAGNLNTATTTFGQDGLATGTTYYVLAFWDLNSNGVWDTDEPITAPPNKPIRWEAPAATTISPTGGTTLSATNLVTPGSGTHTITVVVKDQFLPPGTPSGVTVTGAVTGSNTTSVTFPTATNTYGETTGTYNNTNATAVAPGVLGYDTIVVHAGSATATFYKTWTYTPTFTGGRIAYLPLGTAYNYPGDLHTVTINFLDNAGQPISVAYDLYLKKSNTPTATLGHAAGTGTGTVFSYTSAITGLDQLTLTGTVAGTPTTFRVGDKVWVGQPGVGPDNAVNALGATHDFVITGVPGEEVMVAFSSAGIFDLHNLTLTAIVPTGYAIEPTGTLPIPVANINHIHVLLDGTGTATISVMSQAPGKFYMDTYFGPNPALERTSTIMIKVSKAYAEMHLMDITPTLEINPITQVPTWDLHTVTATVRGEFPVKPATEVPSDELIPPEGGTYEIRGGNELWAINVPMANVTVNWKVQWTDQTVNRVYVSGYDLPSLPTGSHYAPTPPTPFWFTAFSTSDANGEASLTYMLNWTFTPTGTGSCTLHFPCIKDTITASAGYGDAHLNGQYGIITGTATKEWRDYEFKVVKYNAYLPLGNPAGYIPGTKFVLRWEPLLVPVTDLSPVYVPPMWDSTYNIGWPSAPLTGYPGNAYIVEAADSWVANGFLHEGWVTTDVMGEAIWYHLPYGNYGVYEVKSATGWPAADPTVQLRSFTLNAATSQYWCQPIGAKITTVYVPNGYTPTSPAWNKVTFCGTAMVNVGFNVKNIDTSVTHEYYTGANGLLQTNITAHFVPAFTIPGGTWYEVVEDASSPGFLNADPPVTVVPTFYFKINGTGGWDGNFYDDMLMTHIVWPMQVLPWIAWDPTTPRHWVIDPMAQTATVGGLSLSPLSASLTAPATQILTVYVWNAALQPMAGQVVNLTKNFGTLNVSSVVTDASGTATFSITGASAGIATITATCGSKTAVPPAVITFTVVPPPVPLTMSDPTTSPISGVSNYHPVTFSATSNKAGTWTGTVYMADGTPISTLAAGSGITYTPTWAPGEWNDLLTGPGNYAILQVVAGSEVVAKTTPVFAIYNYKLMVASVSIRDTNGNLITNPVAGVTFVVQVDLQNPQAVAQSYVIPLMFGGTYISAVGGTAAVGTTAPAAMFYLNKPSGTYNGTVFVWLSLGGGYTLALPVSFTVNIP